MTQFGLGRRPDPDDRDLKYPLRAILPTIDDFPDVVMRRDNGAWLNQGQTGTCVGHGWAHFVEDGPVMPPGTIDPYWIYREACKIDGWSGNDDLGLDWGTSVRAGANVLRNSGIIREYRHAFTLNEALAAIAYVGPLVIGIDWYDSMFYPRRIPDALGDLRMQLEVPANAEMVGGHCLVANGYNVNRRLIRLKNSWGREWGAEGRVNISFDLFKRLAFDQYGEIMHAKQIKPLATAIPAGFVQEY